MTFIAILIAIIVEKNAWLIKTKHWFNRKLFLYASLFIKQKFNNQRDIRFAYFFAFIPVVLSIFLLKIILIKLEILYLIFNALIFILLVQTLSWKKEASSSTFKSDFQQFIQTYATNFFGVSFWYIVLPGAIGPLCYIITIMISDQLKNQAPESMVYHEIIDKMLFYANLIPYAILAILIALVGDFESSFHYILENAKQLNKSYYILEQSLNQLILLAIGKDKFKNETNTDYYPESFALWNNTKELNANILTYITAILYRAGIFFIGIIVLISIVYIFK